MKLDEYQSQALQTAVYPLERALDYTALGLVSEVGELAEAYQYDVMNMLSEAGDAYWYLAAIADSLGTTLGEICRTGDRSTVSLSEHCSLMILALTAEAGAIAGVVKKSIRDDGGSLTKAKRAKIEYHMLRVLALLDHFCDLVGSSRDKAMIHNLNKLSDRKSRGTLRGSGNAR